jgi:NADH dehydrogenase FAD-containing subunit
VVVAGLGDTGVLVATRLSRSCHVIGISTRPALVSGQELGTRLTDLPRWKRTYLVPYRRFRRLDAIDFIHGRIAETDLAGSSVEIETAAGETRRIDYDAFVIATGVSNGFWRHDRIEDLASIDNSMRSVNQQLAAASTIAVIGGGATGVSVADNLARRGGAQVHLFISGEQPLPDFHPDVRSWIMRRLQSDGVVVHTGHRAVVPGADALTTEPVEWSSGQEPFRADVVLWAVGAVHPHTAFLPSDVLDNDGFVLVDEHLRVPGHSNLFAVGDVAASDPLRSSARNWGYRVIVGNVRALLAGRESKFRSYKPAPYRWGSLLGLQSDGLTVVQPNGKRVRIPRPIAQRLLLGTFVQRVLYGGLRRSTTESRG